MTLVIHTDGGARGNPGPAAIGLVIEEENAQAGRRILAKHGETIGQSTNNVAEYTAVIRALETIRDRKMQITAHPVRMRFYLDSTLVVNQLNGLFKVKEPHLRELLTKIRVLESEVGGAVTYTAVRREQNTVADFLVNQALDGAM